MYEPAIAVLSLLLCACAGEPDAAPTDGPVSDAGEPGDPGSALDAGAGEPDTEPGVDPGDAGTSGDLPEPDSGPCDPWCGEDECGDDDCSGSCGLCDDGNVCTNDTCVEGEFEFNHLLC
jgi:hypothetical protein